MTGHFTGLVAWMSGGVMCAGSCGAVMRDKWHLKAPTTVYTSEGGIRRLSIICNCIARTEDLGLRSRLLQLKLLLYLSADRKIYQTLPPSFDMYSLKEEAIDGPQSRRPSSI